VPIQSIFCNPALSIARLGASSVPMDAFTWVPSEDPYSGSKTRIAPRWTLDVQPDGSVIPRMPQQVVLRDVAAFRPVAPFVEIWCDQGPDGKSKKWKRVPLTASLLRSEGLKLGDLKFTIEAMNFKAARRTGKPDLRFGTFPPVHISGNQHIAHRLEAVSPPTAKVPMIPKGRSINLGRVQVIRPTPQPAARTTLWGAEVDVSVIRFRFTPARGDFFGPKGIKGEKARGAHGKFYLRVPSKNAFLADNAGWFNAHAMQAPIEPSDTFDGAEHRGGRSFGIVDDTCEVRVSVTLDRTAVRQKSLTAHANIFSGPPDFAPDRRPFQSLADALNERMAPAIIARRNRGLDAASLDRWVEDLFERAFETLSLLNVDLVRRERSSPIPSNKRRHPPVDGDKYPLPNRAMGSQDKLRADIALQAPSSDVPLPLHKRALARHFELSEILMLQDLVLGDHKRLASLLRAPFSVASNETDERTTMQMPPFMRGANAEPLTLLRWQHDLLMAWQARVIAKSGKSKPAADSFASNSNRRRDVVLRRPDSFGEF
jgi:hypothetical protein